LKEIGLRNNELAALHPSTFSDLINLEQLWLEGNICINKNFAYNPSLKTIQKEVFKACGSAYSLHELEKLATRFDELEKKLDERDKKNAEEIEETKKIAQAIYEILLQQKG
jgi:hypothetical protein